jgi:hypothetical protein
VAKIKSLPNKWHPDDVDFSSVDNFSSNHLIKVHPIQNSSLQKLESRENITAALP